MARRATTGNKRATTTRHRQPEARAKGLGKLFTGRRLPGTERPCRVTECTILALETGSMAAQNGPFRNAKRAKPQPSDIQTVMKRRGRGNKKLQCRHLHNIQSEKPHNMPRKPTYTKHNPADGTSDCGHHKTFYLISRFVLAVWHIYVIFA